MAKRLSTGFVEALTQDCGFADCLTGGVIEVYTGSQPATADEAASGTLLFTLTAAGGTHTAEVRGGCKLVFAGTAGSVDSILLGDNTDGINLLSAAVTNPGTAAGLVTLLIAAINTTRAVPGLIAVASGTTVNGTAYGTTATDTLYLIAPKGTGAKFNGVEIAVNTTTTTVALNGGAAADDQAGSFSLATGSGDSGNDATVGVAAANGLGFTYPNAVAGVLSKNSTAWQGTAVASGTAGWFRFRGDKTAGSAASTTAVRYDGAVGTSGTEMIVYSTSIASGAVQTQNTFTITIPTSQS